MNAANVETRRKRRLDPSDGRDELNLAEFPIALLAERVPDGQKTLEFQDTIRDQKTREIVTRRLTVTASDKYGLPTAKDDSVILALVQLTRLANGFTEREVRFSRRDIVHLLGWPHSGQSFRRVEESLKRWLGVVLYYEKAWWNNKAQAWVDENFHIIERVSLCDGSRGTGDGVQRELPFSSFVWSEVIFHSFQAGYLKRLDLDFYLSLTSATAKRVYRFLDKRFYHGPRWEFDLDEFAFEHVGLSRTYHTGKIKEKLAAAVEELEARGFLEPLAPRERYPAVRRGEWKVVFLAKAKAGQDQTPPPPPAPRGLEKELVTRGITAATAAELAAGHPAERIAAKLEVFDWLVENKDKRVSTNPAGYLVQSIRDDYAAPKGFEPAAQRAEKKQAGEQRKKKQAEDLAAKRRQEERERVGRLAERAHIDNYLQGMTPQERKALEEQALAKADAKMREAAQGGDGLAGVTRRLLVDREVLRICPLPETSPAV
jgi:hypothetical protein